jgi:hypothetical protein
MSSTAYQAFVKKEFRKSDIRNLPAKRRFKVISQRWKEEKKEGIEKMKPAQTAIELAKESSLPPMKAKLVDLLEENKTFPLKQADKIVPDKPVFDRKPGVSDGPGYPGERHAVGVDKGIFGTRYSFAGPYTQINKRLARGDQGVRLSGGEFSKIDRAARVHDIEYKAIADKFKRTKGDFNPKDVRKSDEKFIRGVRQADKEPNLRRAVLALFGAKMWAEDKGLLSPKKFALSGGT